MEIAEANSPPGTKYKSFTSLPTQEPADHIPWSETHRYYGHEWGRRRMARPALGFEEKKRDFTRCLP